MTDLTNPTSVNFPHSPFVPYDPIGVSLYNCDSRQFAVPYDYTGWRDEQLSWKKTCYIHGNLNPSPTYRIYGPGAVKFLSDHLVNNFNKFPVGTGKHGIMCTEEGIIMIDGVIIANPKNTIGKAHGAIIPLRTLGVEIKAVVVVRPIHLHKPGALGFDVARPNLRPH